MIMNTTNNEVFKDFKVVPKTQYNRRSQSVAEVEDDKTIVTMETNKMYPNDSKEFKGTLSFSSPFFNRTCYQNNFQNFGPGTNYIEKQPIYPIYELPFKGGSTYRESFRRKLGKNENRDLRNSDSNPALDPKEIKKKVSADHIKHNFSQIKMIGRQVQVDPLSVRNNKAYIANSMKPKYELVQNMKIPAQFDTIYRNEYVKKPMVKRKKIKKKPLVW
mmetsp:Transcript_20154/g.17853  ORF Transcript_20154/g.17853 Transcript_20154/m.17853 type:complete len:217 (+) Transcript_20154:300-950(+)